MDRGRGSADQRNQATISHELQKYSRSRTGKGMNSREVAGRLDPCRGDRDVAGGQRAGAEARHRRAGAEARRRQPASRMRHHRACSLEAARSAGVGGWLWGQRKGVRECLLGWAVSNGQIRIGSRAQYFLN